MQLKAHAAVSQSRADGARTLRVACAMKRFPVTSETFILRQLTGLIDLGHDVHIVPDKPSSDEVVHASIGEYDLMRRTRYVLQRGSWQEDVKAGTDVLGAVVREPRALGLCLTADRLAAFRRLQVLQLLGQLDVLHCHFGHVGLRYAHVARLLGIPLIASFYGEDCSRFPLRHGSDVYLPLFRSAAAVTVLSDRMRDRLIQLGCPRSLISKQPLGVEVNDFAFRTRSWPEVGDPIRILTVARLVKKKGIGDALEAVAGVLSRHPDRYSALQYDIIGEGSLRRDLERKAADLGLNGHVRFLGSQTQHEVRRAFAQAHVFILPSVTADDGDEEGTPTVLIEASCCGLPVLSTLHSGIPEIILDGLSGLLVKERDPAGLTERLDTLLSHPESWPKLGTEGRRHVEQNFDIRVLNRRLVSLYEGCASSSATSA